MKHIYLTYFQNSQKSNKTSVLSLVFGFLLFAISTEGFSQIAQRGTATTGTSTNATITINKPTGVVVGDLMIVSIAQRGTAAVDAATLTGWTQIATQTTNNGGVERRYTILQRIAAVSEPASYIFILDADSNNNVGTIVAFSGVDNTTPIDIAGNFNQDNANNVNANSITTTTTNTALIMFASAAGTNPVWGTWTATNPTTLTEIVDSQNTFSSVGVAWATKPTIGATGDGTATSGINNRKSAILIALRPSLPPPTITSLGATSGCPGSSITINGTNLTGATAANVQIGGTPVTSITSNTGTQIIAVIGAGTTGTVTVTTAGGTATSAATFTVPIIAAISGGAATVCTGATTTAFTNATGGGTWSTSNTNATINASGVVTGVTAGAVNVIYTVSGCNVSIPITVITTPSITTNPTSVSITAGGNTSFTVAGSNLPTSYTWEVSTNGGGSWATVTNGGVYSTATTATLNITAAPIGMDGYLYRASATNSCGTSSMSTSATLTVSIYCIPTFTTSVNPISNVTFAGINNTSSNVINGSPAYENFSSITGTVEQGENYLVTVFGNTNGNNAYGVALYADWNQNNVFTDPGEFYQINPAGLNNAVSASVSATIQVPVGALLGNTRIRVIMENGVFPASCRTGGGRGQAEDYTLIVTPATCIQPVGLVVSAITGTSATFSWTAPSPAPANGYNYHISTTNATPSTTVPFTGSVAAGVTSINFTTLSPGFTYFLWVRGNCGSGDFSAWNTTSFTTPLTNNECATAVPVGVNTGPTCGVAIDGTTVGATQSLAGCTGNANDDVWYSFVASSTSHIVTVIPGTLDDAVFQVFDACGGTSLVCRDATAGTALETSTLTGLTIGNTYLVRIYGFNNGGAGTFTLCITTGTPTYCAPTSALGSRYISDYETVGPMANTVNLNSGRSATGYGDFTALPAATQIAGNGINIKFNLAISRQFLKAWVDWNGDGTFTDAAPELVYTTNGIQTIESSFGFIVPPATLPGNYRIRIRSFETSQTFGPCGNLATGETEDYTITIIPDCTAKIATITDGSNCGTGTVNLAVTATGSPTQFRWYDAEIGGNLIGTSATGNWTTPVLTATTIYYVSAFNGCESLVRKKIIAEIKSITTVTATPSAPDVCGENNIVSITATNGTSIDDLVNENFEGVGLGAFNSVIIGGAGDAQTQWRKETSTYTPVLNVWIPAISSRENGNGFAFATSDKNLAVNVALQSNALNTVPYSDLTMTFRHYYSYYGFPYDSAIVEVSTDGGTVWTALPGNTYTSDQAVATNFATVTVNLNAYINQADLRVRFRYNAFFCDGWAIDDVRIFGTRILNASFSWSGGVTVYTDAACTIPYVAQLVNIVYVKPTAIQLTLPTWTFSVTATLGNGCPLTQNISITNKTKVWQGTVSNDWNNANNWLPNGIPDITTCVIIDPSTNSSFINTGAPGIGKKLEVTNGGILEVQNGNSLTIKEDVIVNTGGTFTVKNNSSLIQLDNVANTNNGTFTYERTAPSIKGSDYVYWSSPVSGQAIGSLYTTPVPGPIYQWETTAVNSNGGLGTWAGASGNMLTSKGYIMRGSSNFSLAATNLNAVFSGTPNNGNLTIKAMRGNMVVANVGPSLAYPNPALNAWDDNWTLVGNPYPSAINALQFLSTNSTELEGNVRLWRHLSDPAIIASPFYQTFLYNYNSSDYLTINFTGPTTPGASDIIKTGQAFLVQRREGGQDLTGIDVTFNNAMRLTPTSTVMNNSGFFRSSNINQNAETPTERHRIWLDIVDGATNASETTLVGYVDGATNNFDRNYDATIGITAAIGIYSFAGNEKCIIQGKPLPFIQEDTVPIGINVQTNGSYHIAIKAVDGLFSGTTQNIYLEDRLLNVVHNLKSSPYTFTSNAGLFNNRFVLKYTNEILSTDSFEASNEVKIFTNDKINIVSNNDLIQEIVIYDVLGKTLLNKKGLESKTVVISEIAKDSKMLIVKAILQNGFEIIKKVIH